jgi:hypothetical protein
MTKCKTCGGTGWVSFDLKSDATHSKLIAMGIACEIACTDCDAGRAELEKANREAKAGSR